MYKKLMMACMAIAAFAAFVVAPTASAANLTENGVTVKAHPVGKTCAEDSTGCITGKNVGETTFTAGELTVKCNNVDIPGIVTKDENGTIEGEIAAHAPIFKGTGTGEDCTSPLGATKPTVNSKLCLHIAKGTDTGTVNGCAGAAITFTLSVTPLGISCAYTTPSITGSITTAPVDAQVNIQGQPATLHSGGFLCPPEGKLDMEFILTTQTGGTTLLFS